MTKRLTFLLAATALTTISSAANAQVSASLYTSATRYDAAGRVTGTIAPSASNAGQGYSGFLATRTTYDAAGRPIRIESGSLSAWQSESIAPANWSGFSAFKTIEMTYNAQSQKLTERVLGSDGSLTQYSYDSSGRLECTAVRMNPAVYGSLPGACTLGTQGSDGPDRITRNFYDIAGQLVQVREGVGAGSTIEAAEVTYSYTNNGKIQHVVDAGGHKALMCYDGYDRKVRWVFASTTNPGSFNDSTAALALSTAGAVNGACTGSSGDYEEYGYDANGNRTTLRKRDGQTLTYQYDFLNRNTVKIVPGSTTHTRDVYYSYDLRGLMTSARFDSTGGEGVLIGYDGFGRKSAETLTMDGVSRTMGSQHDRSGNLTILTYPDGSYVYHNLDGLDRPYHSLLNGSASLLHTPFDAAGRLQLLYRYRPSVGWDQYSYYLYDGADRLSTLIQNPNNTSYDATTTFTYNPASQIATVARSNDAYAFAGYANVNRGYTANGLNQYSVVGGSGFGYDANGNLTSDGINSFTYDVENRLVTRNGGASATLRYDPLGRLYEATGSSGTRRFLYDGDALVAEYNASGTLLRRYIHGTAEGDDPLVWFEGSGVTDVERRYLYADERGSIIAVTDSTGYVIYLNTYDEYGIPAAGNAGAFQYTGQVWLPELGMYYYKARMYSPTLGRFMQIDPIGYDDQFNLYAYVGNDPVNGLDATGWHKDAPPHINSIYPGDEPSPCGRYGMICLGDGEGEGGSDLTIVVTAQRARRGGSRPTLRQIAERTMSLPVDSDGGSGARAGAMMIIFADEYGRTRRQGAGATAAAAIVVGLGNYKSPPTGSRGIDQTEWSGDHQAIKRQIGAGATDVVRISPDQEVWLREPDGTWSNHGPASDYTGSGHSAGRTGRGRGRRR